MKKVVTKNERLLALQILTQVLRDKTPLLHAMQAHPELSPLSKKLCFGVSRHYYRLQALADCLMNKRPKPIEVWVCVLMGLYQLHFLRIPDFAVVKETVELLSSLKKPWAKGLVNAVLRHYCREQATLSDRLQNNPNFIDGHPAWFIKRIKKDWPNDWSAILQANDCHPPMNLRVNAQKSTRDAYFTRLSQAGIDAQINPYAHHGIVLKTPCDVYDLPGFNEGAISVQDEAAQLAVTLLDLKPGLRVLDACCAPGGKTCHILETEPKLATCVALDIEPTRLTRVKANLDRLNLEASIVCGDGLQPQQWWDGMLFDRILLDAPCSATGVIRRHPDIKLLRTEEEITTIAQIQHNLLHTLWQLLAPGGLLVYATCSIMPEENEQQIARFIANQSDCQINTSPHPWGHHTGHGWQILPGENHMDGFFYSVLQKILP